MLKQRKLHDWRQDLHLGWRGFGVKPIGREKKVLWRYDAPEGTKVHPTGATIREFTPADSPGYLFDSMPIAKRLPNGNTLIDTWANQWDGPVDPATAPVQALGFTPDKRVVWALRAWENPVDLGPSTTIQLLDEPRPAEAVRFGDLR